MTPGEYRSQTAGVGRLPNDSRRHSV
jgi:hypothetical protein